MDKPIKKTDRAIAIAVLTEITENGAFANIALRKALGQAAEDGSNSQSRAFITELVNETLRNLLLIDHIIDTFCGSPTGELKPFIRQVLRVAVCQIRFLEKIPERAAVDEAVKITKAYSFERLSGFVNGILRNIAREPEKPAISPKDIAKKYSYPPWLSTSIVKWLGGKAAVEFCENSHKPPSITVLVNTIKTTAYQLSAKLQDEGVTATQIPDTPLPMLALRQTGDISKLQAFREGLFIVADPGAMKAVCALDIKPGQTLIDLCAAPGGKSFAAAFTMQNNGIIHAYDIHKHKTKLISQTANRLSLSIIRPQLHDALTPNPALYNTADAVLLDAPCSGLGTIRKHPEIKYTRTPEDIETLSRKQAQMLKNAAKYVKIGGSLVYCTCTIATEENADIINAFAAAHPDFTLQFQEQTLPSEHSDGFFTAKFSRGS